MLDRDGYLDRWRELHGYDPRSASVWVRGWLTVVYVVGRPIARTGLHPDVITVASMGLGGLVVWLAAIGGRWDIAAGGVMVANALVDSLDGCVAVLQERTSRWGYVLDSLVDRVNDSLFLVAVVVVGCPAWLGVACGFGCFLLEYLRARAGNAGGDDVGRITMAERATRVIALSLAIGFSGVFGRHAEMLATVGTAVLAAMTAVAVVQLGVVVHRQLLALGGADQAGHDLRRQGHERQSSAGVRRATDEEQSADR